MSDNRIKHVQTLQLNNKKRFVSIFDTIQHFDARGAHVNCPKGILNIIYRNKP